jgi:hypothetical protein
MMSLALLALLLHGGESFVVDASAATSYTIALPRERLWGVVDDIGLFQRNMPGVVGVTPVGNDTYLYQTEKDIPLSSPMKTDFIIQKRTVGDSVTVYESVNPEDRNYMFTNILIRPADLESTTIEIHMRLRLQREDASEIHWTAPMLGEAFISRQMTGDMEEMLQAFREKSNLELYSRLQPATAGQ